LKFKTFGCILSNFARSRRAHAFLRSRKSGSYAKTKYRGRFGTHLAYFYRDPRHSNDEQILTVYVRVPARSLRSTFFFAFCGFRALEPKSFTVGTYTNPHIYIYMVYIGIGIPSLFSCGPSAGPRTAIRRYTRAATPNPRAVGKSKTVFVESRYSRHAHNNTKHRAFAVPREVPRKSAARTYAAATRKPGERYGPTAKRGPEKKKWNSYSYERRVARVVNNYRNRYVQVGTVVIILFRAVFPASNYHGYKLSDKSFSGSTVELTVRKERTEKFDYPK